MADETLGRKRSWEDVSADYEGRWRNQPGYRGMKWEDIMPGFWYGYEMANDQQYQGRAWSDVEDELRTGYPGWAQRHGYAEHRNLWDRIKDGVREAWDTVTGQRTYERPGDPDVPTTEMGLEGKRV